MPRIAGPRREHLDEHGDAYAALMVRAWQRHYRRVAASMRTLSIGELETVPQMWLDEVPALAEALRTYYWRGAHEQRVRQRDAMIEVLDSPGFQHRQALAADAWGQPGPGKPFEIPPVALPQAEQFMAQAENRLVGIGNLTWEQIRGECATAIASGKSLEDLRAEIQATAGSWTINDGRANTIARTEVNRAMNHGALDQMRQIQGAGAVAKIWNTTVDDRTRAAHLEIDGEKVGLNETFSIGEEPGDAVNCRCCIDFEMSDEDLADQCGCPEGEAPEGGMASDGELPKFDDNTESKDISSVVKFWKKDLTSEGYGSLAGTAKNQVARDVGRVLQGRVAVDDVVSVLRTWYKQGFGETTWWDYVGKPGWTVFRDAAGHLRAVESQFYTAASSRLVVTNANKIQVLYEDLANHLVGNWASTSGDQNPWALAMQMAAKDEFKLPCRIWYDVNGPPRYGTLTANGLYKQYGATFRAFLRAMYQNTQVKLAAEGIRYVKLYRGMRYTPTWANGYHVGDVIPNADLNPMSSFAYTRAAARKFGQFIIEIRCPVQSLVGSARTGFGCLDERELVVLGVRGSATIVSM